jgi:hypothetical protein
MKERKQTVRDKNSKETRTFKKGKREKYTVQIEREKTEDQKRKKERKKERSRLR